LQDKFKNGGKIINKQRTSPWTVTLSWRPLEKANTLAAVEPFI